MDEGEFIIDTIAREYSNMYIYRPMGKVIDKDAVSYGWFTNGEQSRPSSITSSR